MQMDPQQQQQTQQQQTQAQPPQTQMHPQQQQQTQPQMLQTQMQSPQQQQQQTQAQPQQTHPHPSQQQQQQTQPQPQPQQTQMQLPQQQQQNTQPPQTHTQPPPQQQQQTQPQPQQTHPHPSQQQQQNTQPPQTPPQQQLQQQTQPQPQQTHPHPSQQQQHQTQPQPQQTQMQLPQQQQQNTQPPQTHTQPPQQPQQQQQQQTQPQPQHTNPQPSQQQQHQTQPQPQQTQMQLPQQQQQNTQPPQTHTQPPQQQQQQQQQQTQPQPQHTHPHPSQQQQHQTQPQPQQTQMQPPQQQQQTQSQASHTQMQPPQLQTQPQPSQTQTQQRPVRNLPCLDLVQGSREEYLKYGVPLYEASIKCNWKMAKDILDKKREWVRYSITENGETPLHVAASAKGDPKRVEEFVKNLVDMMVERDLELQNKNYNTALYLAAAAGNLEIVKILVKANSELLKIPGAGQMMPLYAAVLFGNKDVVDYIFEESHVFSDRGGWNPQNRGWLLVKCVENNMFDTALKIVNKYPDLESGNVLRILAGKPEAFQEKKSNIIGRTIKSVCAFICLKRAPKKENSALPLLKFIWGDIVKRPKKDIDAILRGLPDSNSNTKIVSGWAVKAMQLQKVIYEHVEKTKVETNIIKGQSTNAHLKLHKLITQRLVNMHVETQNIIKDPSNSNNHGNQPVSNREHLALELQKLVFKHITDMDDKIMKIMKNTQTEDQLAMQLERGILEHVNKMEKETQEKTKTFTNETYSSRVLFIAAKVGNANFLVELIRQYPDLIWKLNDNNQSIFHTAVKHRQEGVYNLLYEIGAMKDLITPLKDLKDNNMLHLVGKIATQKRLEDASGVALQMQLELLWFKEVKNMIPPSYRERENEDGLTPHELFTKEHKDLVTLGEKWMKGTASQCMVVAALIATIVFAATFTVPGGYDQTNDKDNGQKNGIPVFHSKSTFAVFVVADAISLILSSASILMFLSILTSRYAENDFLESLPRKLLLGLATLFLSITTMMIAFGVSFFILYDNGLLWIPILICVFVVIPALLYVRLQYGLFVDVIRSTYRSRYLFKPQKQVLYYENPKV